MYLVVDETDCAIARKETYNDCVDDGIRRLYTRSMSVDTINAMLSLPVGLKVPYLINLGYSIVCLNDNGCKTP